jgi:hypothetical protein
LRSPGLEIPLALSIQDFDFSEFGFDVEPWWIFCDGKFVGAKTTMILN